MILKDQENNALIEQFERREAGVADAFRAYMRVEETYVAAFRAFEEGQTTLASNSTNPR
ncbi:MAG: hypothetical protein HYX92_10650 [Chloroflexi bacterium]|nr:hypothetical protein [Chloroflexota bacterium]